MYDDEEIETIECEHCTTKIRSNEVTYTHSVMLCDDCACMDDDELQELFGEL